MKRSELEEQAAKLDVPTRVHFLKEIFSRLFYLLDVHCNGYFLILSEQADDAYIRLRRMAEIITNTPGLEQLQQDFPPSLPDTLHELGEDADMAWEYGLSSELNTFKGRVLAFRVEAGATPLNDEVFSGLLGAFDKFIDAYRKDKRRMEQEWEGRVAEKVNGSRAMSEGTSASSGILDEDRDRENDERAGPMGEVDPTKVFVVHGRNELIRSGMFSFLRAIGLEPIEWAQAVQMTRKASPYVGEILDAALANAQAIVVIMTPDDEAKLRDQYTSDSDPEYEKSLTPQARPNVLFEAGLAFGRAPDRTVMVEVGKLRPFSDIVGRHTVRLDNSAKKRQELANRLKTAGCLANTDGSDWYSIGDFSVSDAIESVEAGTATETAPLIVGPDEPRDGEVEVLNWLAKLVDRVDAADIKFNLGIHPVRVQHYLDRLEEMGYVAHFVAGFDGKPAGYSLTPKGREYLVENDMV